MLASYPGPWAQLAQGPGYYILLLSYMQCIFHRAYLVEGTVVSLLEDKEGDIVGVLYKEKETGNLKVCLVKLTPFLSDLCVKHIAS